ncbi:hypothetical protein DPMN_019848 [Dreissena polymorpha]|uniref:Uncharacterized protein n=1 Tax=Dreissena polymorpha TaxID=45954 RepID=A0A9D4NFR4_DREPO|nr:hypothetical protein DPMN_019848 [Dreissena polymorpha]
MMPHDTTIVTDLSLMAGSFTRSQTSASYLATSSIYATLITQQQLNQQQGFSQPRNMFGQPSLSRLPLRANRLALLLSQSTTYVAAQYLIRINSTAGATAGLSSVQSRFYDDEVLQLAPVLAFASGSGSRPHGLWWSGQNGNVRQ